MKKKKKVPLRMCLGCKEMKPKNELVRLVKDNDEGKIFVDYSGKKPGRGAYICNNMECLNKAYKAKRFERTFSQSVSEKIYIELKEELENGNPKKYL